MFFGRFRHLFAGPRPDEILDRPLSNYDVIGIPTGQWSSHFFACFSNLVPSCIVSFFLPCIMWSQIAVRAQIPFLIDLKNTLHMFRTQSGYGVFIDFFMGTSLISLGLIIIIAVLNDIMPQPVTLLFALIVFVLLGSLVYLLAHTRTAFREKYSLPDNLPCKGASFWEQLFDGFLMTFCLPCALSQMARHVFQYEHMDSELGLFLGDPSALPPLRPTEEQRAASPGNGAFERPALADEAGLDRNNGPNMYSGAAHRQQAIEARQRQEMERDGAVRATASAPPANSRSAGGTASPLAQAYVVR